MNSYVTAGYLVTAVTLIGYAFRTVRRERALRNYLKGRKS